MQQRPRIAVIGGGIAGLAAALRLKDQGFVGAEITVYEQSPMFGGKLRTGILASSPVELGAEAFLTTDPGGGDSVAVALARRVGLSEALVHPTAAPPAIAVDGRLLPVPAGTLMGVPGDPDLVAALAHVTAERDSDGGRPLLAPGEDVAVGALVRQRLGDEIVDLLVDPMLGGVYAARADDLSLAATMPALAAAARSESTLTGAVRAAQAAAARPQGPVFATVVGGVSRLVTSVAKASGARPRRDAAVRELTPGGGGWRLTVGPTRAPEHVEVDAVVLAIPARPAARLLAGVEPTAADLVSRLDYASIALVTLALPATALPELSGFLVPADTGTLIKAATFFTAKWAHLRRPDGVALVRASVGRYGEERTLHRPDQELVAVVHRELGGVLGAELPAPLAARVQRWGGALPQYRPGHLDRVAWARAALGAHPSLALAGAAYDGIGIPACVRSGQAAAEDIIKALEGSTA